MASGLLSLGAVGFAKQSSQGVSGTPAYFGMFTADGSGPQTTYKEVYDGLHRSLAQAYLVQFEGKLDLTFYASTSTLTELLLMTMGGTDTVTGTAAPYTHTLSLAAGDIPYATFQRQFSYAPTAAGSGTMFTENYLDAKVNSLQITGKVGELVLAKLAAMAGDLRQAASAVTPTFDADAPFSFWNGSLTMQVGGGAITAGVTAIDITLDNQLEQRWKQGKILPATLVPKVRKAGGKLTVLVENMADYYTSTYGLAVGASPTTGLKTGQFDWTMQTPNGANTDSVEVKMRNIFYKVVGVKLDPTGKVLEQDVEFSGLAVTAGANNEWEAICVNQAAAAF